MPAITINLDDLTQAHIDEAAPFIRQCSYASPCIIGALMPVGQREDADYITAHDDCIGSLPISELVSMGEIDMPDDQLDEAQELQCAFDNGNVDQLKILLQKRGLMWTGMSQREASDLLLV